LRAYRAARRGEGRSLTRKQAYALAGEWYRWFVTKHETNPGSATKWEAREDELTDEIVSLAPVSCQENPASGTAEFLARKGLVLSLEARDLFLDAVVDELPATYPGSIVGTFVPLTNHPPGAASRRGCGLPHSASAMASMLR